MAKNKDKNLEYIFPYKKDYALQYYDLCKQGKCLAEISQEMGIPEERLVAWSTDVRHKDFSRAFIAGKTALQAYHVKQLKTMMESGATQAALQTQRFLLQTLFPDIWNLPTKQQIDVTDTTKELSDTELDRKLEYALRKETTKRAIKQILEPAKIHLVKKDNTNKS